MQLRTSLSLLVVLFLAVACAPLPSAVPPASPAAPSAAEATQAPTAAPSPAEAQTYTNPAGFSIQYPSTWKQSDLPPTGTAQGARLDGPEGTVELWWGTGFGGACPSGYSTVKVAAGELPTCHTVANGIQYWEQINKELTGTSFSGRAFTKDATPASADAVLAVLATLAFQAPAATAPAPSAAPAAIANPASQNCIDKGGKLQIEARGDGGQIGVCYFEDNLQCEEWALMRGECPVGGVKVTGFVTPAGRYCAITGGTYAITANSGQDNEQGTCTLSGGVQCDANEYYNGKCEASTGKQPNTSGLTLVSPTMEVCDGMAQALSEALSRANTKRAIMEVTQAKDPVPMTDPSTGAEGTGCRAEAKGTGEDFASPDAVMKQISAVLVGGGWKEDPQLAAGGPTGIGAGFRSGDLVAVAGAIWLPDPAANCPQDQPISACQLTPAQQLYTITLDTAQTVKQAAGVQGAQPAPMPASNPAATNCINVGGTPNIETRADGGEYGVCYFPDNKQCEEWALLRGQCPAGGVKVTGYNTPAGRYCAITGGKYTIIGTTNTGQEAGSCTLPNGKVCDAGEYYSGACSDSAPPPITPTPQPAPIGKPNPASQYCLQVDGTLKIEQRDDVGQIGVCYFQDNRQCEEWALQKGYCPVGGVKVTGYNTPAARYCAITGGTYTPTGTTPDGQEDGTCALPNGESCGVWQYYNGYCGTSF